MIRTFRIIGRFSQSYLKHIQALYKQERYPQIIGIKNTVGVTKEEVRRNYISLIKQYHTDGCHNDPIRAAQYEEITKIIIASYDRVSKMLFPAQKIVNETQDSICQELFGKTYEQAKYWMHQPGNEKQKEAFYRKLKESVDYQPQTKYEYRTQFYKPPQEENQSSSKIPLTVGLPAVLLVLGGSLWFFNNLLGQQKKSNNQGSSQRVYKHQDLERILSESEKEKLEKAQTMIDSILKTQPPALIYPKEEPHVLKQLTNFSIAQDIHLYEVPPTWYDTEKKDILQNGPKSDKLFPLNRVKPNTALTLSLEAERAFQNIYVKVKDVINQIEKTGTFKPPSVLFCFHGYILAEIRDKPISLKNYRDTDYISIFDLYFDYYSPIFLKKNEFSEYLVNKDDPEFFGWVHFNNRKCSPVYLKANEKVAYFHAERLPEARDRYKKTWDRFYQLYEDRWKVGGNERSRAGV